MQPHNTWLGGALAVALILFVLWCAKREEK
jgi:hypothetical protein